MQRAWTEMQMPKSVIDMVDRIGKREQDLTGLTFMDKNRHIMEGPVKGNEFSMEESELMATYPHIGEIQEEILGIKMDNNDTQIGHELDQGEDLDDLAEESAGNADEGGINDDIPTNQDQNETGSQGNINNESENHDVDEMQKSNNMESDENEEILDNEGNQ